MQFRFFNQLAPRFVSVLLIIIVTGFNSVQNTQAQEQITVDQFDLMTATSGWVLLGKHLYWTSNAGREWHEIGPNVSSDASIQDVRFIDSRAGWILWTIPNLDESATFELAQTTDSGATWTVRSLRLFEPGEIASYAERVTMGWFNSQGGWIAVKQQSGSNFSLGTLFTTSDGGNNWLRHDLPISDKIYFSDPQNGWAVGGPAGDQIFDTRDGGANWQPITPANIPDGVQAMAYPPFVSAGKGLLVMTMLGEQNNLDIYALENDPDQWSLAGQLPLSAQPGRIGLSILDAQNFMATIPGTNSILHMENGELQTLENQDGLSTSIVDLDMVSWDNGWAKSIDSNCVSGSGSDLESVSISCTSTTRLLSTDDGGITWRVVDLPSITSLSDVFSASVDTLATSSGAALVNTATFIGQGFDRCEIPTLAQMQTWWDASPYKTVNLYIGGSSRACDNIALTSSYLFQMYQQGWKFFPTWVGPQAPCSGFGSRISSDVTIAYAQGVDEANLAADRLSELGLTGPDQTGSVIYYDIEHYGTNSTCRAGVNAFMNGWVAQLHARGNTAGVYASTLCNTGLSDFRTIANVPDVIWPARWYHNLGEGYYDPTADVWDLGSCVPNTAWSNHQRIRQYEGDHYETWGDLTLDIDSDVLDGVIAFPYNYPQVSSITRLGSNPTSASTVDFKVTFSKSVTGVKTSAPFKDFGLTTDVAGAAITAVSGSGANYTVTVNTGSGNGTIRLDVLDYDSIKDATNNPLGGPGWANGNYTYGELYSIEKFPVAVTIGGNLTGSYVLAHTESTRQNYASLDAGPVRVESTSGVPIVTSLRDLWWNGSTYTSSIQLMGLPENQLSDTYVFPSYNNVDLNDQLRFGNIGNAATTVTVTIGGQLMGAYDLEPNQRQKVNYVGVDNGPVVVQSSNGMPIIASLRDAWINNGVTSSFSQLMGLPQNQLSDTYIFPSYNNVSLSDQLRFGNVGNAPTTVTVTIAGQLMDSYDLQPNERQKVDYPGLDSGPVIVHSSNGVPIIASLREAWMNNGVTTSYFQMMGLPQSQLSDKYVFPAYDNVTLSGQLRFGNVGNSPTTITVTIGGVVQGTYDLAPNQRQKVSYAGLDDGPIVVQSSNGVPIIAALRDAWLVNGVTTSFSQLMGLPGGQMSNVYVFPSYNNVTYDNQLRIGVP